MKCFVILTVAFLASVQAACPPGSCETITCPDIQPCGPSERLDPDGGLCGCCPKCIGILGQGETCEPRAPIGGTLDFQCDDHLRCHGSQRVCITKGPCDLQYDSVTEMFEEANAGGFEIADLSWPDCADDGYFTPLQCHVFGCYCVDRHGVFVEGSVQRGPIAATCPPREMPIPTIAPMRRLISNRLRNFADTKTARRGLFRVHW